MEPRILNTAAAARVVGLGASTLEKLRLLGGGPTFIRLGSRRVGYRRDDLDMWLDTRPRMSSTSEAA